MFVVELVGYGNMAVVPAIVSSFVAANQQNC